MITRKVATGKYQSASEVVREALRLLEEQDLVRRARLGRLRREIERGDRELETGAASVFDAREIKAGARRRLAETRKA
jgi:antitoxin ParD1/3/4